MVKISWASISVDCQVDIVSFWLSIQFIELFLTLLLVFGIQHGVWVMEQYMSKVGVVVSDYGISTLEQSRYGIL